MKLNLGCGIDCRKGWINLDKEKRKGVDVVFDLEKTPLPFKDNSINQVHAFHIFEHINNFNNLLEDLYRICRSGTLIKIKTPYFASVDAYSDPTHVRCFTLKTFKIYSAKFKVLSNRIYFTRKDWLIVRPLDYIVNKFQWIYERFFCFVFPFPEVRYTLEVVK